MGLNVIEGSQNSSSFPSLEHCSSGRLVACIVVSLQGDQSYETQIEQVFNETSEPHIDCSYWDLYNGGDEDTKFEHGVDNAFFFCFDLAEETAQHWRLVDGKIKAILRKAFGEKGPPVRYIATRGIGIERIHEGIAFL